MRFTCRFPEPKKLSSWQEEQDTMSMYIRQKVRENASLNILEAGCGTKWGLDLRGVQYTLTGVDIDERALDIRKNQRKDLDVAILGDLRTVSLEENYYDVIFNSYNLEHIVGAKKVLKNFVQWLKPGGIIILIIPNRDSARAFLTRITPFWFHIFYYRHIRNFKNAGRPGYGPFPVVFDKIVSRKGIYDFVEKNGLFIRAEFSVGHGRKDSRILRILSWLAIKIVHFGSFCRLCAQHANLIYFIEKQ